MTNTIEIPNDTITVQVNGSDKEIFMSNGLLNTIRSKLPSGLEKKDSDPVVALLSNPYLQSVIVFECLRDRNARGKPITDDDLNTFEMTVSSQSTLIKWIADWVVYFLSNMLNQMISVNNQTAVIQGQMQKLTLSSTGMEASMEPTQSAGDLTPSQAG